MPGWVWEPHQAAWEEGFAHLTTFVQREGHSLVPTGTREDGYDLGRWVITQRRAYRQGVLDADRQARLEVLPGWVWHTREAVWEEGFSRLVRFVEREGHARVPQDWSEDGYRLGQWVRNQRSRRRTLEYQRCARLEALPGWAWDKHEAFWEEGFARLLKFVEREGHTDITAKYREADGFRLGSWVHRNRGAWSRGRLSEERARRFEALPGWVWAVPDR